MTYEANYADAHAKLKRAEELIHEFGAAARGYEQDSIHVTYPVEGMVRRALLNVDAAPDPRWSSVVGDAIHNTRSALDAAFWTSMQGAECRAWADDEETHKLNAPVGRAMRDLRKWSRGVPRSYIAERLGAVVACSDTGHKVAECPAPLCRLASLDNVDKHSRLLVMPSAITGGYGTVCDHSIEFRVLPYRGRVTGSVAATLDCSDGSHTGDPPELRIDVQLTLAYVEPKPPWIRSASVELWQFHSAAVDAVERLGQRTDLLRAYRLVV